MGVEVREVIVVLMIILAYSFSFIILPVNGVELSRQFKDVVDIYSHKPLGHTLKTNSIVPNFKLSKVPFKVQCYKYIDII